MKISVIHVQTIKTQVSLYTCLVRSASLFKSQCWHYQLAQVAIILLAVDSMEKNRGNFPWKKIVTSLLVVTSLPDLIQFGGKHLKDMFGMSFISISDII